MTGRNRGRYEGRKQSVRVRMRALAAVSLLAVLGVGVAAPASAGTGDQPACRAAGSFRSLPCRPLGVARWA
jgi:hypothetical protein